MRSATQQILRVIGPASKRIWRGFPITLRKKLAHAAIARLAPKLQAANPCIAVDRSVPKIIVGFLSSPSGLGQSARLAAAAFAGEGFAVLGVDLGDFFFEIGSNVGHGIPDARSHEGPAHLVVVINAPYMPYAFALLGRRFLEEKYVTGYWVWELPRLPQSWSRGFGAVHDLATPSRFTAHAIESFGAGRRVSVAGHPVALDLPPASPFLTRGCYSQRPFTVISSLNVGSGVARKNPLALIRAFRLAFANRRECQLKMLVTGSEHYPPARSAINKAIADASNITVSWRALSPHEHREWWGSSDVYASLHRSEGFGLPLAEAMGAGYPVVATGWSGNMDFMNTENSVPVRHHLIAVEDPQGKYSATEGLWAEPDVEHAAEALQRLEDEPDLCRELARRAAAHIRERLNGRTFTATILNRSRISAIG